MIAGSVFRPLPIDTAPRPVTIPHSFTEGLVLKSAVRIGLPAFIMFAGVAAALSFVFAQPDFTADKPYAFKLDADVTGQAADTAIEPKFNAIAGDQFAYEVYFNATRSGTTRDGAKPVDAFRREENWTDLVTLRVDEDPLDGRKDLMMRLQFNQIQFLLDNGKARYSGYMGPDAPNRKANFKEILPDGSRNEVTNIPGWVGVNAGSVKTAMVAQSRDFAASAWFNVSDSGRLYNEAYFADFNSANQANYPGKLQDPVHLALGIQPEFPADATLKLGETVTVRRRLPVGLVAGATAEYDVTYKLEKLYGTVEKPTAARFSFSAVPVQREHSATIGALTTSFRAPDIKDARLLLDLNKGICVYTRWDYKLSGKVSKADSQLATDFEVQVDFTASLRHFNE